MTLGTHFQQNDINFLFIAVAFILCSLFLLQKDKFTLSVCSLAIAAFFIRFFIIRLDPFLYLWDEQFHALVAKNMLSHPFVPTLYNNPVLPYSISNWSGNYIWLHKQPLFLWLITISFKLFGVNEIALRIPSVIMSTIMVPVIYRMGHLLFNKKTGYYAAFLFALCNYQIEMVSGIIASDHNDVAFMFFVTLSFWALLEYNASNKSRWIYFIGLFSGMAVLVKWIMGFLVFFCWIIVIISDKNKRKYLKSYKEIILSASISLLIAIPWQMYIFLRYPEEAKDTYLSYSNHFSGVLDGHTGGAYYYIDILGQQFGWIVPFVIVIAFYWAYRALKAKRQESFILLVWIVTVYIFYAIVQTKMDLFTIISCPVIFLVLGNLFNEATEYLKTNVRRYSTLLIWGLVLFIGYSNIDPNEIETHHTDIGWMKARREIYLKNTQIYKAAAAMLKDKNYVVFNCKGFNTVPFMFYTGMTAYSSIPDSTIISNLEKENMRLAIFKDSTIPKYITNDNRIVKLDFDIISQ
jgi:4-amino-4-deoxy-L-arabinose transferase-like glycosyltransferase